MPRIIRLATPADAAQCANIYAPHVRDSAVSFEVDVPTAAEFESRITRTLERLPWLVCAEGDVVLGYAYAAPHQERAAFQWSVNVSVYVREGHGRLGVGRALYTSLFACLRAMGYYNAYAAIALPNPASVAPARGDGLPAHRHVPRRRPQARLVKGHDGTPSAGGASRSSRRNASPFRAPQTSPGMFIESRCENSEARFYSHSTVGIHGTRHLNSGLFTGEIRCSLPTFNQHLPWDSHLPTRAPSPDAPFNRLRAEARRWGRSPNFHLRASGPRLGAMATVSHLHLQYVCCPGALSAVLLHLQPRADGAAMFVPRIFCLSSWVMPSMFSMPAAVFG